MVAHKLAMAHASTTSCSSCCSSLAAFDSAGHLLNLALVLEVVDVVSFKLPLLDDGFLVEEALSKGVVLAFNPFSFSFSHHEIQTGGLVKSILRSRHALAGATLRGNWD